MTPCTATFNSHITPSPTRDAKETLRHIKYKSEKVKINYDFLKWQINYVTMIIFVFNTHQKLNKFILKWKQMNFVALIMNPW